MQCTHIYQVPTEVREYEIAATLRREMPEVGSTETVHFKMLPYKNLYVMGQRKFVGSLPSRVALKSNYELNYHITVYIPALDFQLLLSIKFIINVS